MKHVVSLSLGTSIRNKSQEVTLLGEEFKIERIGYDGDMKAYAQAFRDYEMCRFELQRNDRMFW